jgi:PAS domain S-box-containing protein
MKSNWLSSLRFQFFAAIFATMFFLFGGAIFNTNRLLKNFATENTQRIVAQTSEILNLAIVPNTTVEKLVSLGAYLNELVQNDGQGVIYLALLDENGRVLLKTPSTPEPLPELSINLEKQINSGLIHIEQAILLADNRVGRIRYGFSTEKISQAQKKILHENLMLLISGLFFALAFFIGIGVKIGRQFKQLSLASEAFASGNYQVRAFESGESELCRLAHSFNVLADAVAKRTFELQDNESKLTALFNGAQDGILLVNTETKRFIDANPAICTMIGYPREVLLTLGVVDIHHESDLPYVLDQFEKLARGEILMAREIPVLREDGSIFVADISTSRLDRHNQKYMAGFFRDVSKRMQIEKELQAHRKHLEALVAERTTELADITTYQRMLFEKSLTGLVLCRMDGGFADLNPAYLAIIGYTEAEAKVLSYWDITPHDYDEQEQRQLKSLEETGRYGPYEKEYRHKQGYRVPVRLNGLLIEQKGEYYIWSSVEDISQEKANQRQLETIIENLPAVLFIKDSQGHHQLVNHRYEKAVGLSKMKVVGKTDRELFPSDVADRVMQMDQQVLTGGKAVTFEESMPHPDGGYHDYLTTKVPLLNDQGQPPALLGIATDITELKLLQKALTQAKEQAEHLMRVKSEFLANMSHEIRTPLNAVLGLARIGSRDGQDKRGKELFDNILVYGQHLLGLLNDILDFSRLEAGKLVLENQLFPFVPALEKVLNLVSE